MSSCICIFCKVLLHLLSFSILAITESTFTCYTFFMKSILTNTVKITVAAVLAILCAQAIKLDFAVSAGIVAILSVQPTKKETLRTVLARLLAFSVALVISITLFNLMGFTVPVFFLYLLIFILVCQWRKWISAMAMDSVLISHFLSFGKTGPAEIKNEVLLVDLGVAFGIFVNLLLQPTLPVCIWDSREDNFSIQCLL